MTILTFLCGAVFFAVLGFYVLCFLLVVFCWLGAISLTALDCISKTLWKWIDAFTDTVLNTINWIGLCMEKYLKNKKPKGYQ